MVRWGAGSTVCDAEWECPSWNVSGKMPVVGDALPADKILFNMIR